MTSPQWNRLRPYIVQLCLWLVIVSVGWFGVRFLLQGIRTTQNQLQEYIVLAEHRRKQMNEIPRLEEQFAFIQQNQNFLMIVLTKEDLVSFIELLEKIAETSGVKITMTSKDNTLLESKTTVLPGKADPKALKADTESNTNEKKSVGKKADDIRQDLPLKRSLTLSITVSGEYPDIVNFLHKIETMPYALDIIGIHIEEQSEDRDIFLEESGVNPFRSTDDNPDLSKFSDTLIEKKKLLLDAQFETVVYMKE